MKEYKLVYKLDNKELEIGDNIVTSKGEEVKFLGFTPGRLGPKILVQSGDLKREFFYSVFPSYRVEEK